jgi:phosphatidylglycerol:prolipoprotein diacylglycerol transferase
VFNIFDGGLSWIGALLGLGLVAAVILLYNRFGKNRIIIRDEGGIRKRAAILIAVVAVVVMLIGARAWEIGTKGHLLRETRDEPARIQLPNVTYNVEYFAIRSGGLTYYGGFIPAAIAIILIAWRRGYRTWGVADIIAPSLMLGLSFGRIGCFLNGCCWGDVCETGFFSNFAVRFPPDSAAFQTKVEAGEISKLASSTPPVIPTQLMESLLAFGLFLFLSWYISRKRNHGEVLAAGVVLYSVGRFLLEFLRSDNVKNWFNLTFSQNISMATFALGVGFFLYLRLRGARSEEGLPPVAREEKAVRAARP